MLVRKLLKKNHLVNIVGIADENSTADTNYEEEEEGDDPCSLVGWLTGCVVESCGANPLYTHKSLLPPPPLSPKICVN